MSAKLTVFRGGNTEEQYWIEDEVVKIGSGPDCTFVLQGVPSHCLTLLYRGGQYTLVNRCGRTIDVGGEPLLPMATTPVRSGESVALGPDTTLRLDIDGDPAPARRSKSVIEAGQPDPRDAGDDAKPATAQKVRKYATVVAAVLAGGYLFLGGSSGGGLTDPAANREFHELVDSLQSNTTDRADGPMRICRALQHARIGELRGDTDRAIAFYEVAKDMITQPPQNAGCPARGLSPELRNRVYTFVNTRLGSLR